MDGEYLHSLWSVGTINNAPPLRLRYKANEEDIQEFEKQMRRKVH